MQRITAATPIEFTDPLPDAVDAVVIGAGVIGTATAYFLAERGLRVALCEKGRVAGEQSSRNWGWVRQQGRDAAELPIMMESNRIWRGLAGETGEPGLTFTAAGCLYLAENDAALARYESWHDLARQHQLDTRMLTPGEIEQLAPGVVGDWVGGMMTPSDGRAEPWLAVPALARAARRRGVAVIEDCAVRSLETTSGQVTAVLTEKGRIRTPAAVLTAGAWSNLFLSNLGLDLPQLIVKSTVGRTHPAPDRLGPNVSMAGLSVRRRTDGGYSVSSGDIAEHYLSPSSFRYLGKFASLLRLSARDVKVRPWAPAGYPGGWTMPRRWHGDETSPFEQLRVLDPPPSKEVTRRINARLPKRLPWLAEVGMAEMWAGMIDVTPDAVPYLCQVPAPGGLFVGTGLSGHGFGIGPGAGRVLADLVQGRPPVHDLTRFRFDRFADGSAVVPGPY